MALLNLGLAFAVVGVFAVVVSLIGFWFIDAGEIQAEFKWLSTMTALAGLGSLVVGVLMLSAANGARKKP